MPALIALAALTILIFWNILIKGHLLWGSDFIYAYLPYKEFLFNEIQQHGSIPMWNPYLFGGMPFWGFFESTIFYPFDILFWFLAPEKAYGFTMAIHFLMGGVFMFFLCRTLRLSKWGSLFAAVLFSCNSFILPVVYLGRMVHAQSYAWMPLVLCLFVRALQSKRFLASALWAGIAWGMQILAADPQTAFYTFLALMLFALINNRDVLSISGALRAVKILIVLFAVGIGLSAVQLLPSLETISHSVRGTLKTFELTTLYSFPPQGIITTFLPHFFGNLYKNSFWIADMPQSMPHYFLYAGILPWFLMLFLSFSPETNRRLTIYCILLALISLFLALGRHTPVYRFVFHLPGFDSFRGSSKIISLWMLALSILSAKGLDQFAIFMKKGTSKRITGFLAFLVLLVLLGLLLSLKPDWSLRVFSPFLLEPVTPDHLSRAAHIISGQYQRAVVFMVVAALLWFLAKQGYLSRKFLSPLCLCILLADLYLLNAPYIEPSDWAYRNLKATREQVTQTLAGDKSVYRVGGMRSIFGPNDEMYYGLQTVSGAGPLISHRYYQYTDRFYGKVAPKGWQVYYYGMPGSKRFMDFLNVKYEIDYKKHFIRLRKDFLPRVLLVPEYRVMETERILDHMESPDFNFRKTVLLEKTPFIKKANRMPSGTPPAGSGSWSILRYRPNHIHIKVHAAQDGFLLLNDMYYPGWKCDVDGNPQEILRGNYLFRVVRIPKGPHDVRFAFRPFSVTLGVVVTIFTVLFSILVILLERSKNKPKTH